MRRLAVLGYVPLVAALIVIAGTGQPRVRSSRIVRVPQFNTKRAFEDLARMDQLGRAGGGRSIGSRGHAAVAEYLAHGFDRAGLACRVDRFSDPLGGRMANVLAELPGRDDEVIILGAHHDADGGGPAVVDGLTGLAVLLESARALAEARGAGRPVVHPASLPAAPELLGEGRTILFASWDGETMGCAGSAHFVERYQDASRRVRAVISLDSIGWKDGYPVVHSPLYRDRFDRPHAAPDWLVWNVVGAGRRSGVRSAMGDRYLSVPYQVALRMVDLGYYSDDRSFLLEGIPGVFVSDFSLTRFYPHYGSGDDTLAQVGQVSLERAGRLVTGAVHELAEADSLPAGENRFLIVPFPLGWIRLTPDQMRLCGALCLLPGILALAVSRRGALLTAGFAALTAAFLFGLFAVDEAVFLVLVGPVLLAIPILALAQRRGLYAYLATLAPLVALLLLLIPLAAGGYDRQLVFPRAGFATLGACLVLGGALAVVRALAPAPRASAAVTPAPSVSVPFGPA